MAREVTVSVSCLPLLKLVPRVPAESLIDEGWLGDCHDVLVAQVCP